MVSTLKQVVLAATALLMSPEVARAQLPTQPGPGPFTYYGTPGSRQANAQDIVNALNGVSAKLDANGGVITNGRSSTSFSFLNPAPTVDTRFETGGLTNGVIITAGGNQVSYCPVLSCVMTPNADHQRASALFWSTTSDDGHSEEQTVAIETIVGTGFAKTWAPNTAFAVGDNVKFQDARNSVYRVITGGVSAASGAGPSGTASSIQDGSVVWRWINDAAIDAKVGLYNEESVVPGAGNSWVQANNVTLKPGVIPSFNINSEFDFTNNAHDCAASADGIGNCNNLELSMGGAFSSTSALHISSQVPGPGYSATWGIHINGQQLASLATIEDDTASSIGIAFAYSTSGAQAHSIASIVDESGGGSSYIAGGTKTGADFQILSASPVAFLNQGVHASGVFVDNSNSPVGASFSGMRLYETLDDTSTTPSSLNLAGTYSLAAITTANGTTANALITKDGQRVCFSNTDACFVHSASLGRLYYQQGNVSLFSIADTTGNMIIKGTLTQSGLP